MAVHPIAAYREEHGLSQREFAERIGAVRASDEGARVTIARWESGARVPSLETARRIARATGISLRELRPDLAALLSEAAE